MTAYAQSFITGDHTGGYADGYRLESVDLASEVSSGSAARLSVYSDSSRAPGTVRHVLSDPGSDQVLAGVGTGVRGRDGQRGIHDRRR